MNRRSWMETVVVGAVVLGVGCTTPKQSGTAFSPQGLEIQAGTMVLLGKIADGSGADGVMEGSGALMRGAVQSELLKNGFAPVAASAQDLAALLDDAKKRSIPYVLWAQIPIWEDNATEWSGKRDHAGISLELYETESQKLVASSQRLADGTKHPNECATWLAQAAVGALLGRPMNAKITPPC